MIIIENNIIAMEQDKHFMDILDCGGMSYDNLITQKVFYSISKQSPPNWQDPSNGNSLEQDGGQQIRPSPQG